MFESLFMTKSVDTFLSQIRKITPVLKHKLHPKMFIRIFAMEDDVAFKVSVIRELRIY